MSDEPISLRASIEKFLHELIARNPNPDRPTSDDFFRLMVAVNMNDALADGGMSVEDVFSTFGVNDVNGVVYMAEQRALRLGDPAIPIVDSVMVEMWLDGLGAGMRLKTEFPDD